MNFRGVLTTGVVVLWVSLLCGQSELVEMQKKERERRKRTRPSVMEIRDETRPEMIQSKGRSGVTILGKEVAQDQTVPQEIIAQELNAEETILGMGREDWLARAMEFQGDVTQLKEALQTLRDQMDRLVSGRVHETNPVKYHEINGQIQELEKKIPQIQALLAEKEKAQADFLAQARLEGVPRYWLKE